MSDYRIKFESNNSESENYKQRIQKLLNENTSLGDEVRNAQENLRLSANTVAKLNNELKIVCNENDELQKMVAAAGQTKGKVAEYENKIALLSQ